MRTSTLALLAELACNKPASEAEPQSAGQDARPEQPAFAASGETREETDEGLTMRVPVEWERAPVCRSMRNLEVVRPAATIDDRVSAWTDLLGKLAPAQ